VTTFILHYPNSPFVRQTRVLVKGTLILKGVLHRRWQRLSVFVHSTTARNFVQIAQDNWVRQRKPEMLLKLSMVTLSCIIFTRSSTSVAGAFERATATCPSVARASPSIGEQTTISPSIIQNAMKATLSIETPLNSESKIGDQDTVQLGSGVLISPDGLFLSNAHVVGNETRFTIRLFDGTIRQATLIGLDKLVDLALLRIEPDTLPSPPYYFLSLKLSHDPQIGEPVVALGYPMNFGLSATRGIVSGLGRAYDGVWPVDFLQHDAALNPGNSGGPLIDAQGCLLGINTATPIETQFDIGVGLAIPAELIGEITPQLLTMGRFPRGHLGIYVSSIDQNVARVLNEGSRGGLLIDDLDAGGGATIAGLRQGDVITHLDDRPVRQVRDLTRYLLRRRQGEAVQVRINRASRVLTIRVTLSETPNRVPDKPIIESGLSVAKGESEGPGFEVASGDLPATITTVASDSIADRAGMQIGDTILALNGTLVSSSSQVEASMARLKQEDSAAVIIVRIGRADMRTRHVVLRLGGSRLPSGTGLHSPTNTQSLPYGPL
jgi:S1-C subfamily serine protease